MRVVQLHRERLRQALDALALHLEQSQHVLERARHEEVLLREPQALAGLRLVVRIEHLRERLGDDLLADGAVVVADVEVLEVEGLDGLALPESQRVARVDVVAGHRDIARDPLDPVRRQPAHAHAPVRARVELGVPAEAHVPADLGPHDLPGVALLEPLVRGLDLPTVADLLVEDPELVADSVADGRNLERRERIEIAGR